METYLIPSNKVTDSHPERQRPYYKLSAVFLLQRHVSSLSVVRNKVGATILLLQEHVSSLSAVRDEVGAAVLLLQGHVKDVILNFQLSFYCNDTSAMKKSSRERLQKMVQSCKELFSL